jgi:hypothetical protein
MIAYLGMTSILLAQQEIENGHKLVATAHQTLWSHPTNWLLCFILGSAKIYRPPLVGLIVVEGVGVKQELLLVSLPSQRP